MGFDMSNLIMKRRSIRNFKDVKLTEITEKL
jgi:nitroreductase